MVCTTTFEMLLTSLIYIKRRQRLGIPLCFRKQLVAKTSDILALTEFLSIPVLLL